MARKRSDGRYQKHFRYNGKQYTVCGSSMRDASTKKLEKIAQIEQNAKDHDNPTLNDYYKMFTEFRRGKVKESTIRSQTIQFNTCAAVKIMNTLTLGEMHIADIKPKDCQLVQKALEKSNRTTKTVNNCMDHLKHVFNAAVRDETINRNPCRVLERVRRIEPPARETKHRALTQQETKAFFETAEDRKSYFLNAFRLMIQTGMRIGEIGALTLSDIDTANNAIHVTKSVTRDEIGGYSIGDSAKTSAGKRDIPLNDSIRQIIRDQIAWNRLVFGNVTQISGQLFKSPEGKILREYTINREIERITKKAGIEKFTCHAFRATFATRFIEQRPQDYKILSEILGHANTKITLDLYTHVMQETKIAAMQGIVIPM